jgi:glycerol-3-phosphate dehydrogenase (NAD(P)+)
MPSTNNSNKKSTKKIDSIAVLGAGSWGTALACVAAENANHVVLWTNEAEHAAQLHTDGTNEQFFPGIILPDNIEFTHDIRYAVSGKCMVLIVVPSHAFRNTITAIKPWVEKHATIVWATKGLDPQTGLFLDKVADEVLDDKHPLAVISGPSFAQEVMLKHFTAVVVASYDEATSIRVRDVFSTPYFRIYLQNDIVGVEIGGVLKNIIAFAVGAADGLQLGANARAALITRGFSEMLRLGKALGANEKTLAGLSGLGDLILTATDNLSRNRRLGLALGQGMPLPAALKDIGQEVECVNTTDNIYKMIKKLNIDAPICEHVYLVLNGKQTAQEALSALLSRDLKVED